MKRVVLLLAVTLTLAAPAGAAGGVDVVLGSDTAKLATASDGGHTADIDLTNVSGTDQTVEPKASGNCAITPKKIPLSSGYSATVTLTFPPSCDTHTGAAISLVVDPPSTQKPLALSLEPAAGSPRWRHVGEAFGIGFFAALMLALAALLGTSSRLDTELKGLGTSWSFTENWVGNVTVGVTALVTLSATGALGDVVGAGSKPVLGAMAIAAAIGAVFVALGPLILKLVGPQLNVPTVGGTLAAAFVTAGGAIGQATAITWLAWDIASGWTRWGVLLVGAVVGVVTILYMTRTLWHILTDYVDAPATPRSDTLVAATLTANHVQRAVDNAARVLTVVRSAPADLHPEYAEALTDVHVALGDLSDLVTQQAQVQLNAAPRPVRTALL